MNDHLDRIDVAQRTWPEPDILPLEVAGLGFEAGGRHLLSCLLYTSPSPRD